MAVWLAINGCGSYGVGSSRPGPGAPGAGASVTINIPSGAMNLGSQAFGANTLSVASGTTVTWVNSDSVAHTSTSDSGVWDSGSIAPGKTFSFTFSNGGAFPYHCAIHPAMKGAIQVGGS